jgi:outer membrane protein assembly factor BamA
MAFRRIVPSISAFPIIISVTVALAQQPGRTVAKIEVEGLERLSAAEVIATSGLQTGVPLSIKELDIAGQKLFDSGLFKKVAYRTTSKGNQVKVIFQVEEIKGGDSPVVFDNFIWFTNDELTVAIRREVPSFTGMAADAGHMTDDIKRALQNLLAEHHLSGTVEYFPELVGTKQEHVFSVSGVPIPICDLHFPGAKNVSEEKLVIKSRQLTEADYSQKGAIAYTTFILFPIYREVGNLQAKFGTPSAKLNRSSNCKGVELTIPVEEGPIFLWDKANWSGNEALGPNELDEALGMKSGEVANGVKIDKGLHEVGVRYGNSGHLDVELKAEPEFDNATSRVSYDVAVKEGPQYRMGKLSFKGLSEADTRSLEQKWKLKSGDVFDSSYISRFIHIDARAEMQKLLAARLSMPGQTEIASEVTPNRETLTADVTITFKN